VCFAKKALNEACRLGNNTACDDLKNIKKVLVVDVWHTSGRRRAMKLIKAANKEEHLVNIRWVWLDASPNELNRPRVLIERLEPVLQGQEVSLKEPGKKSTGYRSPMSRSWSMKAGRERSSFQNRWLI